MEKYTTTIAPPRFWHWKRAALLLLFLAQFFPSHIEVEYLHREPYPFASQVRQFFSPNSCYELQRGLLFSIRSDTAFLHTTFSMRRTLEELSLYLSAKLPAKVFVREELL